MLTHILKVRIFRIRIHSRSNHPVVSAFFDIFDSQMKMHLKQKKSSKFCQKSFGFVSHWPDFHWNVSKSWLHRVDFFENDAIVAMQSGNGTFWLCKIIKVTSGFNLKKTIFFARGRHHQKISWNIFQIQITPLLWRPQGPQGCLEKPNYPLSSNLVVWCAKIGPKTQKLQKTVENHHFLLFLLSFMRFFEHSSF